MPAKAKLFIALAIIPGLIMLSLGVSHWETADPLRFTIYLLLALVASTLKVRLPGVTGTMSLNFLFILIGVSQLSFSETLALGAVATAMQCVWNARTRPSIRRYCSILRRSRWRSRARISSITCRKSSR